MHLREGYSPKCLEENSAKFACDKATSPQPTERNAHPNSKAAMINAMPIVATFHTSERISGTPAA